ncbi:MAG: hypothetical protein IM569_10055 [Chitinophagaceae bacterium]|nr:hypothetical protein [Chitinophagaceae bacterium]
MPQSPPTLTVGETFRRRASHQRPIAKDQRLFSPPKSLSDAGGVLCGLNVKHSFNRQSQIKLNLAHAAKSPPKAEDTRRNKSHQRPIAKDQRLFSPPKSLSDAGGGLCGLNVKLSSEKSLRRRRWTLRLECETFF